MRSCPACATPHQGGASGYVTYCSACGHRWREIDEIVYEEIVDNHYQEDYAGYVDDNKFEATAKRLIAEQIVPRVPPPAKLLDVGCGGGDFLRAAYNAGHEVNGILASNASLVIIPM